MNILSNIICKCTSRQTHGKIYILLEMNTTFFMVNYFDFIFKPLQSETEGKETILSSKSLVL